MSFDLSCADIGSCPTGWQLFGDYCYYFSLEDTSTWNGAQATCEGMNANLVSIHDAAEQSFLSSKSCNINHTTSSVKVLFPHCVFRVSSKCEILDILY